MNYTVYYTVGYVLIYTLPYTLYYSVSYTGTTFFVLSTKHKFTAEAAITMESFNIMSKWESVLNKIYLTPSLNSLPVKSI